MYSILPSYEMPAPLYSLSDVLDSGMILHPVLNESYGHQHRSPAQPRHTMDSNASIGLFLECLLDQLQPPTHYARGRSCTVSKFTFLYINIYRVTMKYNHSLVSH